MKTTLADFAKATGVHVVPPKKEKRVKCAKCGSWMRRVPNSNVLCCDAITLEEQVDKKTGKTVEVFGPCGSTILNAR